MNFFAAALAPEPEEPEVPEQPEPVDIRRATSDFLGVQGWTRESAVRPLYRYETAMERYERERGEMPEAPQASAMQDVNEFKAAQWAAINEQVSNLRSR